MDVFTEYLARIDNPQHRARMAEILSWVAQSFPNLTPKIAWNQPMFTDHDTFIIGFSISKQHIAVAPERVGIIHFSDEIVKAGYDQTNGLVRILWKNPIDFELLEKMIAFNISDKANCSTFWRK
jgi:uncharacterized protein YdhG (YjbR/CyaY superfamily)